MHDAHPNFPPEPCEPCGGSGRWILPYGGEDNGDCPACAATGLTLPDVVARIEAAIAAWECGPYCEPGDHACSRAAIREALYGGAR